MEFNLSTDIKQSIPNAIVFNFEELKAELSEKIKPYETLAVTEDDLKSAKSDKATLNKLKKALNDKKVEVKKEYISPLENFEKLIKFSRTSGVPMSRYVFNSLIVTVLTVGLSLLFTTMSAFALAKLKFKGRDMMMNVNQMALMFVATAVLIPRYLVIAKLGLIDNIWAHILPLMAYPVALFLVKQLSLIHI